MANGHLEDMTLAEGSGPWELRVDPDVDEWIENWAKDFSQTFFPTPQLDQLGPSDAVGLDFSSYNHTLAGSRKRPYDIVDASAEPQSNSFGSETQDHELETLRELLPELFPQSPSLENRQAFHAIENPFFDNHTAITERHPALKVARRVNNGAVVNGYLKFVVRSNNYNETGDCTANQARYTGVSHRYTCVHGSARGNRVARSPPGFGSNAKIDADDQKILKFYTLAICGGRTLLPKTNAWLDLGRVIDGDECARHAALAFSAGYMLDYIPTEKLRVRTNFHYKRASELLKRALNDPSVYEVGKEEGVVTALHLLWSDDIVQWELRRPKSEKPRWRRGTQTGKAILDATDPGYRYWKPEHVQTTSVRRSNANMCAYAEICALPVTELHVAEMDKLYPWLLEGSEEDVREIHGGTGVCPKILHIYAQITQLSARITKSVPPIYETIKNFWNWIDAQPFSVPAENVETVPLSKRTPWWELMVWWLLENYGELSLV
ncbi:hypothetical protein QQX98_007457 [Neonectria punicea]|uniref:Uncharacterized protein n=1 Tax=Neonectria punicea TaxID=979145 RepID=A0ABR1GXZ2_9HYPO